MPIPANSHYVFRCKTYTTTQEDVYGIDFSLGASSLSNPPGGIAKATSDRGTWDKFFTFDQILPDDGTTQTATYNVTSINVQTVIQSGVVTDDTINWGPEMPVSSDNPGGDDDGGNDAEEQDNLYHRRISSIKNH